MNSNLAVKLPEDKLVTLVQYLNSSETDIINEYVLRYFNSVMNGQVENIYSSSGCSVAGAFRNGSKSTIHMENGTCSCSIGEPIEHTAYYINSPFSLDWLNQGNIRLRGMNILERNVISAILKNQTDMNENSMTNILDSVLNKKDLDEARRVLKNAYKGDTRILSDENYYYHENNVDFDFRNISAGLKSFALIERLLETGVLKRKDVLILDEPEIHLHSEWQILYAELIVVLQKTFELTILLVTHSSQFLESLNFYMEKYGIAVKGNYYIPEQDETGVKIVDRPDNLIKMKKV